VGVLAPAEELALVGEGHAVFGADRDVHELDVVLVHLAVVVVGGDLLAVEVEHLHLHRVHRVLDNKLLVVALGDAQLQAVVLAPRLQVIVDAQAQREELSDAQFLEALGGPHRLGPLLAVDLVDAVLPVFVADHATLELDARVEEEAARGHAAVDLLHRVGLLEAGRVLGLNVLDALVAEIGDQNRRESVQVVAGRQGLCFSLTEREHSFVVGQHDRVDGPTCELTDALVLLHEERAFLMFVFLAQRF